jgi:hypothetical protein
VPGVALGHGFTPVAFAPGRYATAIQRTMHGTHALQVLKEDSTAAFMLELAADGTATACRGWRYEFRNDGPQVHTADHYREQQGYRGRYGQRRCGRGRAGAGQRSARTSSRASWPSPARCA